MMGDTQGNIKGSGLLATPEGKFVQGRSSSLVPTPQLLSLAPPVVPKTTMLLKAQNIKVQATETTQFHQIFKFQDLKHLNFSVGD